MSNRNSKRLQAAASEKIEDFFESMADTGNPKNDLGHMDDSDFPEAAGKAGNKPKQQRKKKDAAGKVVESYLSGINASGGNTSSGRRSALKTLSKVAPSRHSDQLPDEQSPAKGGLSAALTGRHGLYGSNRTQASSSTPMQFDSNGGTGRPSTAVDVMQRASSTVVGNHSMNPRHITTTMPQPTRPANGNSASPQSGSRGGAARQSTSSGFQVTHARPGYDQPPPRGSGYADDDNNWGTAGPNGAMSEGRPSDTRFSGIRSSPQRSYMQQQLPSHQSAVSAASPPSRPRNNVMMEAYRQNQANAASVMKTSQGSITRSPSLPPSSPKVTPRTNEPVSSLWQLDSAGTTTNRAYTTITTRATRQSYFKKEMAYIGRGFINDGNTCYCASVLQLFLRSLAGQQLSERFDVFQKEAKAAFGAEGRKRQEMYEAFMAKKRERMLKQGTEFDAARLPAKPFYDPSAKYSALMSKFPLAKAVTTCRGYILPRMEVEVTEGCALKLMKEVFGTDLFFDGQQHDAHEFATAFMDRLENEMVEMGQWKPPAESPDGEDDDDEDEDVVIEDRKRQRNEDGTSRASSRAASLAQSRSRYEDAEAHVQAQKIANTSLFHKAMIAVTAVETWCGANRERCNSDLVNIESTAIFQISPPTRKEQAFVDGKLPTTLSMQDLLDRSFRSHRLDGYKCECCKEVTNQRHRTTLLRLPDVMWIQLKRFDIAWDSRTQQVRVTKNKAEVVNTQTLLVPTMRHRRVPKPRPTNATEVLENGGAELQTFENVLEYDELVEMELYGIGQHMGSLFGGHYYAHIDNRRAAGGLGKPEPAADAAGANDSPDTSMLLGTTPQSGKPADDGENEAQWVCCDDRTMSRVKDPSACGIESGRTGYLFGYRRVKSEPHPKRGERPPSHESDMQFDEPEEAEKEEEPEVEDLNPNSNEEAGGTQEHLPPPSPLLSGFSNDAMRPRYSSTSSSSLSPSRPPVSPLTGGESHNYPLATTFSKEELYRARNGSLVPESKRELSPFSSQFPQEAAKIHSTPPPPSSKSGVHAPKAQVPASPSPFDPTSQMTQISATPDDAWVEDVEPTALDLGPTEVDMADDGTQQQQDADMPLAERTATFPNASVDAAGLPSQPEGQQQETDSMWELPATTVEEDDDVLVMDGPPPGSSSASKAAAKASPSRGDARAQRQSVSQAPTESTINGLATPQTGFRK